ncbi:quinon protein alcohol dehydrogenase-like superfamily [Suillus occidentalis]|nr:quinon protein alcohol dehydrogenase-like superfamily [Suillus occidentalis]
MSSSTSKTPAVTPSQTMRGHTKRVCDAVHLPDGRRIITCSWDGSLRLWDLKSGTQIGEDWRDENPGVFSMALSPNSEIVASGHDDGKVKLWDVETRKVIATWIGHRDVVFALCWSADGERVASGSWDGTARVWDVKRGKNMMTIKTGHSWVRAMMYSPDSSKFATGGDDENAVKIWEAKTGELLNTLEHDWMVHCLGWTSDGKRLISGSLGLIRIFDTATWKSLNSVSFSRDGIVLVTACHDENAYTWDVHAILKEASSEVLLPSTPNVSTRKPSMNGNATRRPPIQARQIPQGFFDGVQNSAQSSAARGTHCRPCSTQAPLLDRFTSLFRHSHADGAIEPRQHPTRSIFSRQPPIVEVSAVRDKQSLFVARRPERDKATQTQQQQSQSQGQGSSTTPHAPGTNAATPGARPTNSRLVRFLAHLVLFLCCTSAQRAGANLQPTQIQLQGHAQTQPQPQAQASSSQTQPTVPSTSTFSKRAGTPPAIADPFRSLSLLCISPTCRRTLVRRRLHAYLIFEPDSL